MKSFVKPFTAAMCAVVLCIFGLFSYVANAETVDIEFDSMEDSLTLNIPDSISLVTSGMKQSSPLFTEGGLDYIQTMSKIRENNDYLYGVDSARSFEFEIIVSDNTEGVKSIEKLSDKKKTELSDSISSQADVLNSSFYNGGGLTFIESSRCLTVSSERFFSEEYFTVYNRKNITILFKSANDSLSASELELLRGIVDSVEVPVSNDMTAGAFFSSSCFVLLGVLSAAYIVLAVYKVQYAKNPNNAVAALLSKAGGKVLSVLASRKKKSVAELENQTKEEPERSLTSEESEDDSNFEIDLEAAIANFTDNSSERRERKRNK